jgi:hypothetical protein
VCVCDCADLLFYLLINVVFWMLCDVKVCLFMRRDSFLFVVAAAVMGEVALGISVHPQSLSHGVRLL